MKIRGKVIFINFVSIIVAFMLFTGIITIYFRYMINPTINDYYDSRHELYDSFYALESKDDIKDLREVNLTNSSAYILIDFDGNFVKSFPVSLAIHKNETRNWTAQDYMNNLSSKWNNSDRLFYPESISNEEAQLKLFYFSVKPEFFVREKIEPFYIFFFFLGLIILVASLMSVLVLQKTGSNVERLEKATRQIADGNLDFSLTLHGNDEIAGLANSFNAMRLSLKDERTIRNRFLLGVSHDLKTPITTIKGYLEAIKDGFITDEKLPRTIDRIMDKTELLESRIYELINYVKLQTGEWSIAMQNTSIAELFADIEEIYSEEIHFSKRKFSFVNQIKEDISISLDVALFIRLIENLINNAIKYSDENTAIKILLEEITDSQVNKSFAFDEMPEKSIAISVINQGKMLSQEEQNLLFEPFYRAEQSRNTPGFGLGLSIVKSIVDAHGWQILVDSKEDIGVTFKIIIPLLNQS